MRILVILAGLLLVNVLCRAQDVSKDSIVYRHGLPVTGEDTVRDGDSVDRAPLDILIPVPPHEIPGRLRRALEKTERYKGWEASGIFRDSNTGLYILSITEGNTTRTYGFNSNGRPVTFHEKSIRED